jgi:hypothetical protein
VDRPAEDLRVPRRRARVLRNVALAAVPLVLLATSQLLRTPFYLSRVTDPSYIYLFNALNLAELAPPVHVDHPGTPVQLLGALAIRAEWIRHCLTDTCGPVAQDVVADPERYLRAFQATLAVGFAIALFIMGAALARARDVLTAVSAQVTVAAFGAVLLLGLPRVSAEPMLATVGALLVAVLAAPALGPQAHGPAPPPLGRALAVGGVLGLGIATKVTFLPLVAVTFLLRGARARALALATAPVAFVVCTLPALSQYPQMFHWLWRLATHRGRYAKGPEGLPGISELTHNVAGMVRGEPVLFAFLALYAVVALAAVLRPPPTAEARSARRVVVAVSAVIVLQVAITAKYTSAYYLLPAMMVTPLANAALIVGLRAPGPAFRRWSVAGALALVLLLGIGRNAAAGMRVQSAAAQVLADRAAVMDRIATTPGCAVVEYYGATSIRYGLELGNSFAGQRYAEPLAALHPDALFFDIWRYRFSSYSHLGTYAVLENYIARGGCALLVGEPLDSARRADLDFVIALEPLIERRTQAAYRILGIR